MKRLTDKRRNQTKLILMTSLFVIFVGIIVYYVVEIQKPKTNYLGTLNADSTIQVVAGENFWGSLVSQIGGNKVHVTSIVSDPNADPHEYESNVSDAKSFANANYVILNGAGYDSWGNKLLSANPNSNRTVLNVANVLGQKDGVNPHFWYNPTYVNSVIVLMEKNLANIDPSDASYFQQNLTTLQSHLKTYQKQINAISIKYPNAQVAATEDIFAYLASASNLNLISPSAFTEAVAEGNDPPTDSVVQFQNQLKGGYVKLLVYNEQTVTPLTTSIKQLAYKEEIPVVGVTETMPRNTTFQAWMSAELTQIQNALAK
jgi:zinc/manganese transport system substrate-binding protein